MRRCALLAMLWLGCSDGPPAPACTRLCTSPSLSVLDVLAGQPGGPGWVDGVGAVAHFTDPWTFAGDGAGHLYLADASSIRRIDIASANVTTLAGTPGRIGGDDGPGASASFNLPSGLAADSGALYVADTENHTLRKVDLANGQVTTIAGAAGVNGDSDDVGTAARFREPEGLALDAAGSLYIADTDNDTIRRMDLASGAVSTIAGLAGVVGSSDGMGAAARFHQPKALTLDGAGNLYILDHGNSSLRKLVLADASVSTLVTFATVPNGLAWDGAALAVSLADQRIVSVDPASGALTTLAGAADQGGFVDGAAADARFLKPAGLYSDGGIYVADEGNYALRKLVGGEVSTPAGASSSGSSDGTGAQARFFRPQAVVADFSGVAWVADTNNHTLRKVVLATGEVETFAGAPGQMGASDGERTVSRFNQPSALALDDSALYIADSGNHQLRKLDLASGGVTTLLHTTPAGAFFNFNNPAGLALDGGNLFISDAAAHTIARLDLRTGQVTLLAGSAATPGSSDGSGAKARFYAPTGLVADGRGHLYVADLLNDTIRKIEIASGAVTTPWGLPQNPGSDDGVGPAARFAYPSQLALDGVGDLFVADSNNHTVRHIDLSSGAVTTVIGSASLSGVRLGPLPAQLTSPSALALTADARLLLFSENALLEAH